MNVRNFLGESYFYEVIAHLPGMISSSQNDHRFVHVSSCLCQVLAFPFKCYTEITSSSLALFGSNENMGFTCNQEKSVLWLNFFLRRICGHSLDDLSE